MTREAAAELAAGIGYYVPEAAELLMVAASDPTPSEQRVRACKALRMLDPYEDILLPTDDVDARPSPSDKIARAIGIVCMQALQDTSRRERERLLPLIEQILSAAERIQTRRRRRAA